MTSRLSGRWFHEAFGVQMEVKTVVVIGAGTVGQGFAYLAAVSGYRTILEDVSDARREQATVWIARSLERAMADGTLEAIAGNKAAANLSTAHTVENAIRVADLIIETLPDEMEMQIELFTILDKFAKPNAIFASTGLLSITELAEVTFCADRCIGMRCAGGPVESKTIELVKGLQTSSETIAACSEVARRLGKAVVVSAHEADKVGEPERKLTHVQD
jgi:3-hydroxybutyryl-CoA dehydrogenase